MCHKPLMTGPSFAGSAHWQLALVALCLSLKPEAQLVVVQLAADLDEAAVGQSDVVQQSVERQPVPILRLGELLVVALGLYQATRNPNHTLDTT